MPRPCQYTYHCWMRCMRVHTVGGRSGGMRSRLQTLPLTSSLDDSTCLDKPPGRFQAFQNQCKRSDSGHSESASFITGTNLRVDGGSVISVQCRDIPGKERIMSHLIPSTVRADDLLRHLQDL